MGAADLAIRAEATRADFALALMADFFAGRFAGLFLVLRRAMARKSRSTA
ncbi:MAG: hypothetical protein WEB63_09055 [Cucumibacter sp.]